jgi:hypothetical protein
LPVVRVFAGNYIDKKCPFTGNVSIRGRILTGETHASFVFFRPGRLKCRPILIH